jgi:hypothetical protein
MKSNLALLASVSVLALTIGAAKADTIDFIGAEISYTVPVSGLYDITAYGAQGGPAVSFGGLGAEAGGDIFLSAGTTLTVLAGGQGAFAAGNGGGGGGGSFVFEGAALLVAAGGGGGGSLYGEHRAAYVAGPGLATTAGGAGKALAGFVLGGPGGIGGLGGRGGVNGGGGGAGVSGPGGPGIPDYGFLAANGATSITSFGARYAAGGFGGGGGGGYSGGGGGGGFSGGGGGSVGEGAILGGGGGGGGSYLAPVGFTDPVLLSGVNHGNGFVTIDPVVPEPSTWAMALAGFGGLGWLARLRARKSKPA